MSTDRPAPRVRRPPPAFRAVTVRRVQPRSPRLVRITFGGPELAGFTVDEPAASVRLLLPSPGRAALEVPAWNGNEFLLADGTRPIIRTFTPMRADPDAGELDLEIVLHGHGATSAWAAQAEAGQPAAVSGPGRGYTIDPHAPAFLLGGDESALPAISQLLPLLPSSATVRVVIEAADASARIDLPPHPHATVTWLDTPAGAAIGDALVAAVEASAIDAGTKVWVAGEAAAVQRVRRHLSERLGHPRANATVRGYWKVGRAGTDDA